MHIYTLFPIAQPYSKQQQAIASHRIASQASKSIMFANAPEFLQLTHYYPCYINIYSNERTGLYVIKAFNIELDNDWVEEGAGDNAVELFAEKLDERGLPGWWEYKGSLGPADRSPIQFPYHYTEFPYDLDRVDAMIAKLMGKSNVNGFFYKNNTNSKYFENDDLFCLTYALKQAINAMSSKQEHKLSAYDWFYEPDLEDIDDIFVLDDETDETDETETDEDSQDDRGVDETG